MTTPSGVRSTIARSPSSLRSKIHPGSSNAPAVSLAFIGSPWTAMPGSVPRRATRDTRRLAMLAGMSKETPQEELEAAEREVNSEPAYKEGEEVWVQDDNGNRHSGVFVGMNEAAGWFGGGPSAYVVHPEGHQAEVVSLFRITPK